MQNLFGHEDSSLGILFGERLIGRGGGVFKESICTFQSFCHDCSFWIHFQYYLKFLDFGGGSEKPELSLKVRATITTKLKKILH